MNISQPQTPPKAKGVAPDALDLEIFRYAMESVVDELEVNLTRTAFSQNIYEYKDYCVGFLTRDFRLLTQSPNSVPIFLADLGEPVRDAVTLIGPERLEAGDILFTNYAAVCGQHLNNVIAAMPVYDANGIAGYIAARTHWMDVGGMTPLSTSFNAKSVLQEGFQLRGMRIVRAGEVVPELLATIQANTYMPEMVTGDLMAQIAACKLGGRRWQERVGSRWSSAELDALVNAQFEASRRLARQRIEEIPDGEYYAECRTDDGGAPGTEPMLLSVKLKVNGGRMVADLSGLPPQSPYPINTGANGGAVSAMRCAFKGVVVPDRPADDALFDPLEVEIPPGTVLSAVNNAPLSYWSTLLPTMVDLFIRAIGSRLPEKVPAGHHGALGAILIHGRHDDGSWWSYIDTANGGYGGHAGGNGFGPLKTLIHGDNPSIPVELAEARAPVRFSEYRLLHAAGGEGRYRGGPGTVRSFQVLAPATAHFSFERTLDPPWGLAGGEPGTPGKALVKLPGDKDWTQYDKASGVEIKPGTYVQLRNGGGGGWGKRENEVTSPSAD